MDEFSEKHRQQNVSWCRSLIYQLKSKTWALKIIDISSITVCLQSCSMTMANPVVHAMLDPKHMMIYTAASSPVERPGKAFCNSDMQLFLLDKGCEFLYLNKKRADRFEAWYGIWYHHDGMIPSWWHDTSMKEECNFQGDQKIVCVSTNKLKKTVRLLDLSKRKVDLPNGQMWGTLTKPLQISYVLLLFFWTFPQVDLDG